MAFGSDEFPLGPAGGFPRKRIFSAGVMIPPPMTKEEVYMNTDEAKLPVVEKDFHSSVARAHSRMKYGMSHDMMRLGRPVNPRYTERGLNRGYHKGLSGVGETWGQRIRSILFQRQHPNYGALVSSARLHEQTFQPRGIRMGQARRGFFGAFYR